MRLAASAAEALQRARQVEVNGRQYTLAEYVGAAPTKGIYVAGNEVNDDGLPQAFLVIQPPGAVTPAHFHEPNQFQVFVEGGGRIGAHPTTPLTVQYANGHTPYGPIVASEAGIQYFTLRQRWDPGAKYLPASRDMLVAGGQRARVKGGLASGNDGERTGESIETVFATEPDGLAGWLYRLGPDNACTLPDPSAGGGQYLVVVGGALRAEGRTLGRHAVLFLSPEEPAFQAVPAGDGLDLLVLQFPVAAAAANQGSA
ncbi:MAG TPA: hypothetical protein VJ740_10040 [Hyphomicrobiaceae bacterium]|nr:hypothetical protein [Hyphomicrobiaceae bacterium]